MSAATVWRKRGTYLWGWSCHRCSAEGLTDSKPIAEAYALEHMQARHSMPASGYPYQGDASGLAPANPSEIGCHESEVPRSLLPADVKPWELWPSDARVIGSPVLRYGTEDSRARRLWRLNSP